MSARIRRQQWLSAGDALNLVTDLKNKGATVAYELDPNHVLRSIMWATPEQILLSRTYGGIVVQDNTMLTNRCH